MNYRAWFECFEECGETYVITEVVSRCKGGALLDVRHDQVHLLLRRMLDLDRIVGVEEAPLGGGRSIIFFTEISTTWIISTPT